MGIVALLERRSGRSPLVSGAALVVFEMECRVYPCHEVGRLEKSRLNLEADEGRDSLRE